MYIIWNQIFSEVHKCISFETSISMVPLNFNETGRIHRNINYQVVRYPLVVTNLLNTRAKMFDQRRN